MFYCLSPQSKESENHWTFQDAFELQELISRPIFHCDIKHNDKLNICLYAQKKWNWKYGRKKLSSILNMLVYLQYKKEYSIKLSLKTYIKICWKLFPIDLLNIENKWICPQ